MLLFTTTVRGTFVRPTHRNRDGLCCPRWAKADTADSLVRQEPKVDQQKVMWEPSRATVYSERRTKYESTMLHKENMTPSKSHVFFGMIISLFWSQAALSKKRFTAKQQITCENACISIYSHFFFQL